MFLKCREIYIAFVFVEKREGVWRIKVYILADCDKLHVCGLES